MKERQIKDERRLAKLTDEFDFISNNLMNTNEVGQKKKEELGIWKTA